MVKICYASHRLPLPLVIDCILEEAALHRTMSKRLVPLLEKAKEEIVSQTKEQDLSIEQEIECPRCHDVMTLCSQFDRLGYHCEECSFSLHLSH
jgi:hypothetical protein